MTAGVDIGRALRRAPDWDEARGLIDIDCGRFMRLSVPKRRVPVELSLAGQTVLGEIFLSDHAPDHFGPQRVVDRLNGEDEFLPIVVDDEKVALIARASLRWVRIAAAEHGDAALVSGEPTRFEVFLALDDGSTLSGAVAFAAPPGRSRLQDFVNDADRFFPLFAGEAVYLVNKGRVAQVRDVP